MWSLHCVYQATSSDDRSKDEMKGRTKRGSVSNVATSVYKPLQDTNFSGTPEDHLNFPSLLTIKCLHDT